MKESNQSFAYACQYLSSDLAVDSLDKSASLQARRHAEAPRRLWANLRTLCAFTAHGKTSNTPACTAGCTTWEGQPFNAAHLCHISCGDLVHHPVHSSTPLIGCHILPRRKRSLLVAAPQRKAAHCQQAAPHSAYHPICCIRISARRAVTVGHVAFGAAIQLGCRVCHGLRFAIGCTIPIDSRFALLGFAADGSKAGLPVWQPCI